MQKKMRIFFETPDFLLCAGPFDDFRQNKRGGTSPLRKCAVSGTCCVFNLRVLCICWLELAREH